MDESTNGHTAVLRLDLLDSLPERKPVDLGAGRVVQGHVRGRRVLRRVEAEFNAAYESCREDVQEPQPDGTVRTIRKTISEAAWQTALTLMVLAVLPGIDFEEADALSQPEALAILSHLGWVKTQASEPRADPLVTETSPTTATSKPPSPASTAPRPRSKAR